MHVKGQGGRGVALGHFAHGQAVGQGAESLAAVLLGHGQVHQPVLAQVGVVLGGKEVLCIVAGRARGKTLACQMGDHGDNLLFV